MGITGVILALPLTAAARVAVDYMIENRRLPLLDLEEQPMAPDMPADAIEQAASEDKSPDEQQADKDAANTRRDAEAKPPVG